MKQEPFFKRAWSFFLSCPLAWRPGCSRVGMMGWLQALAPELLTGLGRELLTNAVRPAAQAAPRLQTGLEQGDGKGRDLPGGPHTLTRSEASLPECSLALHPLAWKKFLFLEFFTPQFLLCGCQTPDISPSVHHKTMGKNGLSLGIKGHSELGAWWVSQTLGLWLIVGRK